MATETGGVFIFVAVGLCCWVVVLAVQVWVVQRAFRTAQAAFDVAWQRIRRAD